MNYAEMRLKFRHFMRKNKRIILLILAVWLLIFVINLILGSRKAVPKAETTYEPHTSVIDSSKATPKSLQQPIEEMIDTFVDTCNNGNYQKAFDMLSDDCKEYSFNNDVAKFMAHVLVKMPEPRKYSIQGYSTVTYDNKKMYIYEVKYTEDFLATGLTNSTYAFTSEKYTFYRDDDGNLLMNIGDYIYHTDIKSISENEYLKIDVVDKIVEYETETYKLKFTNRSEYIVVVADGEENEEIILALPNEVRKPSKRYNVVLHPGETYEESVEIPKFVDDGDVSQRIVFPSIRVMEKYSGVIDVEEEVIQEEINNAVAKFSMEVKIAK